MKGKLTAGQRALVALIAGGFDARYISAKEARDKGLGRAFATARRARLIQSAQYECSAAGDEFLESAEARAALAQSKP